MIFNYWGKKEVKTAGNDMLKHLGQNTKYKNFKTTFPVQTRRERRS
jgi:hypothetical protein